ncbi:uncharacterized protein LOC143616508 [Bidens hawaiensis]|uniref:uncharacterized protein LOC143616508 n=1 Tax=Bidens hawaiensis TaxID=980011 RepID=UPI00404A28C7
MTLYRGVRCHLKGYSTRAPQNAKELFNLRHASLHNSDIFLACCILHNFLLEEDRDIDLEDEVIQEVLHGPQEEECHNTRDKVIMSKHEATGKKETLKWTENMDNAFIQAMITQKDNVKELRTKFQMNVLKKHLKNRLKTVKEHFSRWYDLFRGTSLSGFSWNSTTRLIEAEDEVRDKLIESKPEAEAFKMKKVSNFNEMQELFAKDRASGAQAETAKERNARFHKNDSINLETFPKVDDFCAANDVILESQYDIDDIDVVHPTSSLPEQSSSAKKCKSRKRKVEQENEDLASMIMNNVGSVANAILEGNKILERAYHREYTGEEICNALEPMGLESHEIRKALKYLVANQADTRMLFSCPSYMRLGLLRDMMGSGN